MKFSPAAWPIVLFTFALGACSSVGPETTSSSGDQPEPASAPASHLGRPTNDPGPAITPESLVSAPEASGWDFGWSRWTSEETPPITCDTNTLVDGFACSGGYCDNVRLHCQSRSTTYGSRTWSSYFSEEATNFRTCSGSGYVSGIACQGSSCDNIAIECTSTSLPSNGCVWSGYFSEEDPAFVAPANAFIKGIQCNGSRCDNKRYYYCQTL